MGVARKKWTTDAAKAVNHIDEAADVVDGHHRLYAAKMLGIKNVPAEKTKLPYKNYYTESDLFWE